MTSEKKEGSISCGCVFPFTLNKERKGRKGLRTIAFLRERRKLFLTTRIETVVHRLGV